MIRVCVQACMFTNNKEDEQIRATPRGKECPYERRLVWFRHKPLPWTSVRLAKKDGSSPSSEVGKAGQMDMGVLEYQSELPHPQISSMLCVGEGEEMWTGLHVEPRPAELQLPPSPTKLLGRSTGTPGPSPTCTKTSWNCWKVTDGNAMTTSSPRPTLTSSTSETLPKEKASSLYDATRASVERSTTWACPDRRVRG